MKNAINLYTRDAREALEQAGFAGRNDAQAVGLPHIRAATSSRPPEP